MPTIYVDREEDPLKVYKRYRMTIWYKRITRKQWFIFGVAVGLLGLIAPQIWTWLATTFDGGILGMFL